jgi:transcriptional regulator with XRE-family HTH domain
MQQSPAVRQPADQLSGTRREFQPSDNPELSDRGEHRRMVGAEDERLGLLLRAIRRRTGRRQSDVAKIANVPRRDVILIEAGRAGSVPVDRLRRVFAAMDARVRVTAWWWNGAAADRLLDERHAALVERALAVMRMRGWQTAVEVTFSEWGERGSIDILGGHRASRALAVGEVKTVLGSIEETNRMLDIKERFAPRLATTRFGWTPESIGRLLILPADSTVRRTIARHALTMDSVYPARSREVRAWLRRPESSLSGLWFLSEMRRANPVKG